MAMFKNDNHLRKSILSSSSLMPCSEESFIQKPGLDKGLTIDRANIGVGYQSYDAAAAYTNKLILTKTQQ